MTSEEHARDCTCPKPDCTYQHPTAWPSDQAAGWYAIRDANLHAAEALAVLIAAADGAR